MVDVVVDVVVVVMDGIISDSCKVSSIDELSIGLEMVAFDELIND